MQSCGSGENSYSASNILTSSKTRTLRNKNGQEILKYCSLFEGRNPDGNGCPYPFCNEDIVVPENSYYSEIVSGKPHYYAKKEFMKSLKLKVKSSVTDQQPDDPDFFNTVYACQIGNKDIVSGDGYRFRGRGFIQITGYGNYKNMVQANWDAVHGKGDKDFLCRDANCDANIEEIANDLEFSMQISLAFWKANNVNSMIRNINNNTIVNITVAVNGAKTAIKERTNYTNKAYEVLKK